jgi:hypothetical protein
MHCKFAYFCSYPKKEYEKLTLYTLPNTRFLQQF